MPSLTKPKRETRPHPAAGLTCPRCGTSAFRATELEAHPWAWSMDRLAIPTVVPRVWAGKITVTTTEEDE